MEDGPPTTESAKVTPGDGLVAVDLAGTRLGLSICYDLRFPELYRALALAGAEVLAVPAVFTERTGPRPLGGAPAGPGDRERGVGRSPPASCGAGGPGAIPAWGHSMVVDPWGRVVAQAGDDEAIVRAELDLDLVAAARRQIPALANVRPDALPPAREVDVA